MHSNLPRFPASQDESVTALPVLLARTSFLSRQLHPSSVFPCSALGAVPVFPEFVIFFLEAPLFILIFDNEK